jgi:hypothetical protein
VAADQETTIRIKDPHRERPFRGWAWRGADLPAKLLAHFLPGRIVKHLGPALLGRVRPGGWPVQFAVFIHRGWRTPQGPALSPNPCFEVRAILPLPGGQTCVALEQVEEDSPPLPSFQRRLRIWLDRAPETRPGPDEGWRTDWLGPFAQWLPHSRPGDAPVEAAPYAFEDAVRFAAAWTGVDEAIAWRILEARELGPERVGMALEEADGLARELVAEVGRGRLAYLDHLGLVSWADPGERRQRLGLPDWLRQGRKPAAGKADREASATDGPGSA